MGGARGEQLEETAKISRTILVVEDEILVRMVVADKLREAAYTVIEVASADEALNVLVHRFDVKLVLSKYPPHQFTWFCDETADVKQ